MKVEVEGGRALFAVLKDENSNGKENLWYWYNLLKVEFIRHPKGIRQWNYNDNEIMQSSAVQVY